LRGVDLMKDGALLVREVWGSKRDAYSKIDDLEERILEGHRFDMPVLLCLGPTATVLAARLARKGVHAIDLGHVGMFMRRSQRDAYAKQESGAGSVD